MLFLISTITTMFILSDIIMNLLNVEGRYYLNHFIGNMIIVYITLPYMLNSYNDNNILIDGNLDNAISIVYSTHIYHMLWYYSKLRYDDILHHLVMVGLALPLTSLLSSNNLIGHCLFFITGLPGGIDYFMLFLIRNNMMDKMIEKKLNRLINLWIRCPGCISNVTLVLCNIIKYYNTITNMTILISSIIMGTVFWNGIYFMEQVVVNYALNNLHI